MHIQYTHIRNMQKRYDVLHYHHHWVQAFVSAPPWQSRKGQHLVDYCLVFHIPSTNVAIQKWACLKKGYRFSTTKCTTTPTLLRSFSAQHLHVETKFLSCFFPSFPHLTIPFTIGDRHTSGPAKTSPCQACQICRGPDLNIWVFHDMFWPFYDHSMTICFMTLLLATGYFYFITTMYICSSSKIWKGHSYDWNFHYVGLHDGSKIVQLHMGVLVFNSPLDIFWSNPTYGEAPGVGNHVSANRPYPQRVRFSALPARAVWSKHVKAHHPKTSEEPQASLSL